MRLTKFLYLSGFPLAACAYSLSLSAMWSGLVRPGDFDYANIGGLIPFSDAHNHLAAAFDQAKDGTWGAFAIRRPLAAAFRSVLLFLAHYSFPWMLLLQTCLLAGATWAASYAVTVWRGVWAGVGFFALTYVYVRIFAPTSLSEPLGLFWALLSVPFFINAFSSGSEKPALVGFAMTAFALMTRMGNMFGIPVLLVWLVWQFGRGVAAKVRIGLISIAILLGVFGLNALLAKAYSDGNGSIGSNFSFVLCGMTLGKTWEGCPKELESRHGTALPEDVLVAKMYSMAWQNFRTHPEVFLNRFKDAVKAFYTGFPSTIWKGYGEGVDEPKWFCRLVLVALLIVGITVVVVRRSATPERRFWLLLWASLTVSAGFVYFDDGPRVLAASYPMIAMFLAMGLATPLAEARHTNPNRRLTLCGSIGLLVAAVLFASVPWISYEVSGYAAAGPEDQTGDAFVYGGKRMSGFLVIANGAPLRNDIPTIHLSDFEDVIYQSGVEANQGLLHPVAPELPFGFVFAPRTEKNVASSHLYIVPAKVMERFDVAAWRFKLEPWRHEPNFVLWFYVTDAKPWPVQGREAP